MAVCAAANDSVMRLSRRDRVILFAPAAVLLTGWLILPAVLGLLASLTDYSPFAQAVHLSGLTNYAAVLSDHLFTAAVRNVAVLTMVAVPFELAIGFGLAYLLRGPIWGRRLWRVLLLLPWLVSPIASGVMWHFLLGPTRGILNFALGWIGRPELASPTGDIRLALPTTIAVEIWRVAPLVTFLLLPGVMSGMRAQRRRDRTVRVLLLVAALGIFVLPLVWTALAALGVQANNSSSPPSFHGPPTLDHFSEVGLAEPSFWQELFTSTAAAACAAVLAVAAALLTAYGLARSRFPGDRLIIQWFLVLASLPAMAYVIPLSDLMRRAHLIDTFAGVVLTEAAVTTPLAIYVLYGALVQLSTER